MDGTGSAQYLDGIYQDVERRYRRLFEEMPVCIFLCTLKEVPARIVEANRRAAAVYGYAISEFAGLPVEVLASRAFLPQLPALDDKVRQGQTVTTDTTNRRRDGTPFPVSLLMAPDPTDSTRMIIVAREIGVEKQGRRDAQIIDAERLRIAHDIHDGVAQDLAGLRFKSELWAGKAAGAPPRMQNAIAEMRLVLITAIEDLRRAIFALRPVDLDEVGFFPALTQLLKDSGDLYRLEISLILEEPPGPLAPLYEAPLYRMIQEGLTNVGQHASATSAQVRLAVGPAGDVSAVIRDDGQGFDPELLTPVVRGSHFGLRQMRERIVELGGTLDIHSAPGQGAELAIELPPCTPDNRT